MDIYLSFIRKIDKSETFGYIKSANKKLFYLLNASTGSTFTERRDGNIVQQAETITPIKNPCIICKKEKSINIVFDIGISIPPPVMDKNFIG